MARRALITGSPGFFGRHFVQGLRVKGVEVFTVGRAEASPTHFTSVWNDLAALERAIAGCMPDVLIHLAGVARGEKPSDIFEINCGYAANLLEARRRCGLSAKPLLLIGSAAEYGYVSSDELPVSEKCIERPCTLYGLSKYAQTRLGLMAAKDGEAVIIARPFNLVGPGMPEHLALGSFLRQIRTLKEEGGQVLRVGNIKTARDYLWVTDAVDILWALAQNPESCGQIVNVCSGVPLKIESLLQRLLELAQIAPVIEIDESRLRAGDTPVHYGDPTKMIALSGLTPQTDVLSNLKELWGE